MSKAWSMGLHLTYHAMIHLHHGLSCSSPGTLNRGPSWRRMERGGGFTYRVLRSPNTSSTSPVPDISNTAQAATAGSPHIDGPDF